MTATLRVIFAGTPDFAAHHLQALIDSSHDLVACYTQPDRPAGRGKKLQASPVKQLAMKHQIPVHQPKSLKNLDEQAILAQYQADIMIVVAYGLILPPEVLRAPRLGCINVHASLLPRWRGAAPIQRAIEAGDKTTGVTIMQMDAGLDTGDMLLVSECPILPTDTGGSLHDRLLTLGAPALLDTLTQLVQGTAIPRVQDDALSNYAAKINKAEAALDWRQSAVVLSHKIRAFNPFPVAFTARANAPESRIRIWQAHSGNSVNAAPGTIYELSAQAIVVACGTNSLHLTRIQLPGKRAMDVAEILRGHPHLFSPGESLEIPA